MLLLTIFLFWKENWTLDYNSMEFWDFHKFCVIFGKSSVNSYLTFFFSNNQVSFHLLWKKHLESNLQSPKYDEHSRNFQAHMGHGTFNSKKYMFRFNYLIEYERELAKITAKSKKKKQEYHQRQISKNSKSSVPKRS